VSRVINWDVPQWPEDYEHYKNAAGSTGGFLTLFVTSDEQQTKEVEQLEHALGKYNLAVE
jgi:superfamily II DNA/RNA helicase